MLVELAGCGPQIVFDCVPLESAEGQIRTV